MSETRVSFHNGRAGKKGTYSDKHNDRNFDLDHADHIDKTKTKDNIYINYLTQKVYSHSEKIENEIESFSDSELKFYEENFGNFIKKRNEKNKKNNNYSRIADAKKIKTMERYAPEEVIFQIGNQDNFSNEDFNKFLNVYNDFIDWYKEEYPDIKLLNAGIHVDETTPHIHLRQVYTAYDKDGDLFPSQTDCLKNMGIKRPDPTKKKTKYNNPKVTFSQRNRNKLLELCEEYGLEIETEPLYGGKKHQEKNDYIVKKQEAEKQELSENNYNLRAENINLITNNSKLKKENKALKENNISLELENRRFKAKNKDLEEENKKLKKVYNNILKDAKSQEDINNAQNAYLFNLQEYKTQAKDLTQNLKKDTLGIVINYINEKGLTKDLKEYLNKPAKDLHERAKNTNKNFVKRKKQIRQFKENVNENTLEF
jgi:hypothetical protein